MTLLGLPKSRPTLPRPALKDKLARDRRFLARSFLPCYWAEATDATPPVSHANALGLALTAVAASARRSSPLAASPVTIPAADAKVTAPAKMKFHVVFIAASV